MITAVALPAISATPSVTDVTGSLRGGGADGAGEGSGRSQANGAAPSGSHAGGVTGGSGGTGRPGALLHQRRSGAGRRRGDRRRVRLRLGDAVTAAAMQQVQQSRHDEQREQYAGPSPPNTLPIVIAAAMASPTTSQARGRVGRGVAGPAGSSGSRIQPAT